MNDSSPDPMLDALFARARAQAPDTARAEYAFETRLLARLRAGQKADAAWGVAAWRMIPVLALVVLGLACWKIELGSISQGAAQAAVENPEAADLLASFN